MAATVILSKFMRSKQSQLEIAGGQEAVISGRLIECWRYYLNSTNFCERAPREPATASSSVAFEPPRFWPSFRPIASFLPGTEAT